ncbi:MAG: hypothetical protein ACREA9_18700, partial [Pyrinomonadaceae bacterium]
MTTEPKNETDSVVAVPPRTPVSPIAPAPIVIQIPQKKRDLVDWVLAAFQLMTLVAVIIYVVLTGRIAVATKNATESAVKTTKAQIAVTLVDQLYSDRSIQDMLALIYNHDIEFSRNEKGEPVITSLHDSNKENLEPKISLMLNRFQILGQLYDLGTLERQDLRGLRYEIIEIGRNKAVREYFDFLNHDY